MWYLSQYGGGRISLTTFQNDSSPFFPPYSIQSVIMTETNV